MNPVALRVTVAAIVPVLVALIYFGVIATDRYVSESSVVVRSGNSSNSSFSLGGLLPVPSGSAQDLVVVSDFIQSMEMAVYLDKKLELRDHYTNSNVDFVSRLETTATTEEYHQYLQSMIGVVYEESSEVISVTTRAFTASMAQDINREIIRKSEELINQLSDRIARDTLGIAKKELDRAIANAKEISGRRSRFAVENESFDPGVETNSLFGSIASLDSKLSEARALYTEKSAYLRESSAEMRAIKNRISGLQAEISRERSRLSDESGQGVGHLLEQYKPLLVEEELAKQRYAAALMALESARKESQQQKRYLETFVQPNLPTSSTEPDRLFDAMGSILVTFLLYAIFALCRAAVREHIDFAH
ncbi:hypothetical protein AB833_30370 [Chromatiales bacterium (ex Bugula neritina AB1)]|nr:hypothetical protein AB833_30370 [Chromatiales bacterium (ex Bugula neritina AB1)]